MTLFSRVAVLVAALAAAPAQAQAPKPLYLEVLGSASTAEAGDSQLGSLNRAILHVLATNRRGQPVAGLAPGGFQGNETGFIALPAGWAVTTLQVGAGGCNLAPTGFRNAGNGVYRVSLMSRSSSGACAWRPGDYVLHVTVAADGFSGTSLGLIEIE